MVDVQTCPGRCNARYRREQALYRAALDEHAQIAERLIESGMADQIPDPPQPPKTEPVYGDPVWCPKCRSSIRMALADLDELASQLAALPPGIKAAIDGPREQIKVSGSHADPSPSPAMDDLDDLATWLRSREDDYRKIRDWPGPPRRGFLAGEITSLVAWLGAHLDEILLTGLAENFGQEALDWHRRLIAKTHAARSVRHVKKRCPRCQLFTLWEELGADYIRCVNTDCNRMMTREELHAAAS